MSDQKNDKIVHSFEEESNEKLLSPPKIALFVGMVLLGIGSAFLVTSQTSGSSTSTNTAQDGEVSDKVEKGQIIGSEDESTFKDKAEGLLKEGGIDGEGAYHLERPGGVSQNVYLTSSVLDLSPYIGREVRVWGETFAAEKAGWLMDVGRLQVLE